MSDQSGTTADQGAAGAETTPNGGAAAGGQQEAANSPLMQEFEKFRTDITSRFEGLEQRFDDDEWNEPDEETGGDGGGQQEQASPTSPQFTASDFDPATGDLRPEAQTRALKEMMMQVAGEALAPVQGAIQQDREARMQERRDAYADYLENTYPELQNPDKQNEIAEKAQQQAAFLAQRTGIAELAELWREPSFYEQVFLAEAGRNGSGAAGAAGQKDVTLETGGSAGPAAPGPGDDEIGDAIVAKAKAGKFRLGK